MGFHAQKGDNHWSIISKIFFDLRKAFVAVSHRPLMQKLQNLDVDRYLLKWIHSYLSGRKQRVVVDGDTSSIQPVASGVPQGSVLRPLLFIIYIDGVLSGLPIERFSKFKYLGVHISSDLSWSLHVWKICAKGRRLVGLLYRRFHAVDTSTCKQLYVSFIRPHLEYACQVWDPHLKKDIEAIGSVQKFAVRACTRQWDTSYQSLLTSTGLPTLEDRRQHMNMFYVQNYSQSSGLPQSSDLFQRESSWTSTCEWPQLTWIQNYN